MVNYLLNALTEREKYVLQERFGFGGSKIRTLESIGVTLKVTRERVRQIEGIALRKLRNAIKEAMPWEEDVL